MSNIGEVFAKIARFFNTNKVSFLKSLPKDHPLKNIESFKINLFAKFEQKDFAECSEQEKRIYYKTINSNSELSTSDEAFEKYQKAYLELLTVRQIKNVFPDFKNSTDYFLDLFEKEKNN